MTLIENKLSECGIKANNMRFSEFPTYKNMITNIFKKSCKDKKSKEMLENMLSPLVKSIACRLLKEKNILCTFTENYNNGSEFRETFEKTYHTISFIGTAFIWRETKQGHFFWSEISQTLDEKLHFIMNHDFNI